MKRGNPRVCVLEHSLGIPPARGATPGVFGVRPLTFFERERTPRARGRKPGPRAPKKCCYAAGLVRKICSVRSELRAARKRTFQRHRIFLWAVGLLGSVLQCFEGIIRRIGARRTTHANNLQEREFRAARGSFRSHIGDSFRFARHWVAIARNVLEGPTRLCEVALRNG